MFRLDAPAWAVIATPDGYNCRCRAHYLSDHEMAAHGLKPAVDWDVWLGEAKLWP